VPSTSVHTLFDCGHASDVSVDIDSDVEVPAEVRGLGKCGECMEEDNLVPISGVQPQANGRLVLDSIFLMPIE
jgi:hypothetical protein